MYSIYIQFYTAKEIRSEKFYLKTYFLMNSVFSTHRGKKIINYKNIFSDIFLIYFFYFKFL